MDGHLTRPLAKIEHFRFTPIYTDCFRSRISRTAGLSSHCTGDISSSETFERNLFRIRKDRNFEDQIFETRSRTLTRLLATIDSTLPREWMDTNDPLCENRPTPVYAPIYGIGFQPVSREPLAIESKLAPRYQPVENFQTTSLKSTRNFRKPESAKPIGTLLRNLTRLLHETNGWTPTRPLYGKSNHFGLCRISEFGFRSPYLANRWAYRVQTCTGDIIVETERNLFESENRNFPVSNLSEPGYCDIDSTLLPRRMDNSTRPCSEIEPLPVSSRIRNWPRSPFSRTAGLSSPNCTGDISSSNLSNGHFFDFEKIS
ncbi:hypothetical protein AVEN_122686-1 [Araneus ventricosus]|uniref:Uncharacterized protein n=1 Tax=Araneus ventricosus TaxID=182803 RepID=A0A4Y2P800_ARAVE|nr:hypothetical protein AVEN_122686-1 [Araneus ventricosus]